MTNISTQKVDLEGDDCHSAVTQLLLDARGEDPMAGLWEASDLQWWWATDDGQSVRRDTFWLDDKGQPDACLLTGQNGAMTYTEFLWRPSLPPESRDRIVKEVVGRLVEYRNMPGKQVWITVDERDTTLLQLLESQNFKHDPADDIVQMWLRPSEQVISAILPDGMTFDDARAIDPEKPHHLVKRNGDGIAEKLAQQSLYRPDLDLCIRAATGDVAAYCLCWMDSINKVGLFEPVRTEDAYQKRGLGRAMMVEGIRRLTEHGASLIKVSRDRKNIASGRLYKSVGFIDATAKLRFIGKSPD